MKKTIFYGWPLLFLAACNTATNTPKELSISDSATAKIRTDTVVAKRYTAAVNDLRIRETPTLDGTVLLTVKKGEELSLTGKRSENKLTVELNGKKITDVFYEVNLARGGQGWVFAGAITTDIVGGNNTATISDRLITATGIAGITPTTTEADLIKMFGKENVVRQKEIYANGDVPPCSGFCVFKDKPNELLLGIDTENNKKKKLTFILIRGTGGKWHTKDGVKVGTTLAELNTINGKPFLFSGLGWDYGGYINDFQKGKLWQEKPAISLRLDQEGNLPVGFSGDVVCKSDAPELKKATLFVGEIFVNIK
jgi:hypothetical protein